MRADGGVSPISDDLAPAPVACSFTLLFLHSSTPLPPDLLSDLRETLDEVGLGAYADRLLPHARVAVDLVLAGPATHRVGESRLGGAPDLPEGSGWPLDEDGAARTFLLQVNLADIPAFDGSPLPSAGMLYLFLGLEEPASDVSHVVLLHTGPEALAPVAIPEDVERCDDTFEPPIPHALRCALRADLPHWATNLHERLTEDMTEDEQDAMHDLSPFKTGYAGQLLGHVAGIGQDPREDAVVAREFDPKWMYDYERRRTLGLEEKAERWQNLIRVDSAREADLNFWDAGYLNVLIREDALEALDLSGLYVSIETS